MTTRGGGGGVLLDRIGAEGVVVSNVNSSQKSKSIRVLLELLIGAPAIPEVSYEFASLCPSRVFLGISSLVFSDILHEVRGH